MDFWA